MMAETGRSADSITQCCLDFRARLKGTENLDGRNRCSCEIGRNVGCDNRQSKNLDMKRFTGRTDRLKIQTAVMPQTKIELASRDGLLHRIGVTIELGSDRRTDEVGTIGVETLPDQKIDVPQIDEANVNRELFTIHGSGWDLISHLSSIYHLPRGYMDGGFDIARARCGLTVCATGSRVWRACCLP